MAIEFGRRKPAAPVESLQKSIVDLARKFGLETEGPDALSLSEIDIQERVSRARAELDRKREAVIRQLAPVVGPECAMRPFLLVPESCWNGPARDYLYKFLRITPFDGWNIAFLPANEWTALVMGTPLHPGTEENRFSAWMETFILGCRSESDAVAAKVRATCDASLIMEAKTTATQKIVAAAQWVGLGVSKLGPPSGPGDKAVLAFLSQVPSQFRPA